MPRPDTAALHDHDPDALARYVLATGNAWWRRRIRAHALAGLPEPRVPGLADRIRDAGETAEVCIALPDLLADRAELLLRLRDGERGGEGAYGVAEAVLQARGLLGARTAATGLAALTASPRQRWREIGEAGLGAQVEHHGARRGPGRARRGPTRGPPLRTVRGTVQAHARSGTRGLDERLGSPRTRADGLDGELRRALVHAYAPRCGQRSDPRWLLEALGTERPGRPTRPADPADRLARASPAPAPAALAAGHAGVRGGVPPAGRRHLPPPPPTTTGTLPAGHWRRPASAGSTTAPGGIRVTGLRGYHFGSRAPDVDALLFPWQD
ncbi:hypothetical protein AB0953_32985 [Streptomyces sp. NPDC046866]|uniref:hypothetical protein n=1 Tax=Streptomyces sp. NPDC046866 TaxID=3154921 RepID=UPI00345392A1